MVSNDSRGLAGKRVLVTGGAGFIGSHLVDGLLEVGAEKVAVVDNFFLGKEENLEAARRHGDRVSVHREDAGEFSAMAAVVEAEKPDIIYNLATKALLYSFINPAGAFKTNTDIAAALGELLRHGAYGKLVHCSTSEVFGSARTVPMHELHPLKPETSYAAGKAGADLLLQSYVNMFGLEIMIVRPFNNYGPRQNSHTLGAVIPVNIRRLLNGEPPILQGDGTQTRDFIYVSDTVAAMIRLGARLDMKGKDLNLGSGKETSIKQIIDTLCELTGYTGEIVRQPKRSADVLRHCADTRAVEAIIGPVSTVSLRDGLEQTLAWTRDREAKGA